MENAFAKIEDLADTIKEYLNNKVAIEKLNAAEKTAVVISNVVTGIVITMVFLFCLLFASVTVSILLGLWIGKIWAGFLIVSFFYLLTGIIVWVGRTHIIILPVMKAIIDELFPKKDE